MLTEEIFFLKNKYGKEFLMDCALFSASKTILRKHPFIHDYYGIYMITKGNGAISLDNNKTDFCKGTLIFFQPGQIRQWHNVSDNFDGYFLAFKSEFIETFFQDIFFLYRFQFFHTNISCILKCESVFFNQLIDFCQQIMAEIKNLQDDSHHLLRSILYTILIQINRKFIEKYNLSSKLFQNNKSLQFLKLLEENIRKYHKVEDYAQLMNISRSQLNNIVKATLGKPVSVQIKERLIIEIKRDLLFTNKSIKEICFDINFKDVSNFIRFYKNSTNKNPNAFRLDNAK